MWLPALWLPAGGRTLFRWQPFHRHKQRSYSEERHERHATQAGAIHDPEPHMFVWCRFEFDRFPDERVVSAKPVVARCDFTTGPLTE